MIFVYILLIIGLIFQIFGVLALHRFPDVYTRLHGATICTTFGSIFLYLGVIIYGLSSFFAGNSAGLTLCTHTFLVMVILLITNPTASHAIARAAYIRAGREYKVLTKSGSYKSGILPQRTVVDELKKK